MNNNYTRRDFLKFVGAGASSLILGSYLSCDSARLPNFVIIFTDDQGYNDVGCYGATKFQTPNLDRMAEEGVKFTDFYVASSVCTPSRAALLTGCYPQRVGLPEVIGPKGPAWAEGKTHIGLNSNETTIAEMLKPLGYATACFGKWHLGHLPPFFPTRHGFDEFFGLPYSNDMNPAWDDKFPDLPLMDGERVVEYNPDQTQLTTWFTERAVDFIEKNKNRPFFLYVPHPMPHVPLSVSQKFKGRSEQGIYGDVIMEIDWSVGQILDKLNELDLDENTVVMFTSDNGPWLKFGDHGGSAEPLRGGKFTTFEGGQRVPFIVRWPGKIPAGNECHEIAAAMDILPTIAFLSGAKLPERTIDGKNIWPLLENPTNSKSPHQAIFFYLGNDLQAVRSSRWKLHFPHPYKKVVEAGSGGIRGKIEQKMLDLALYDLEKDISEQIDLADQFPDIVASLSKMAKDFDTGLKNNIRPAGVVPA